MVKIIIEEKITQKNPAKAVVVNFGVSLRHLKETENIEKLNEMALGNSVNEYYGQQLAIHSGCLYGKNYFSPY